MASSEHYLKKELYELVQKDSIIFEFLQGGSLDGIWYWDLEDTDNEWMSSQFWTTLGYDPQTKRHLASEWQDLINPEDLQTALENFKRHCEDPNYPYDQVVRYRHKNGSTVWVRCRGIAVRDKDGKPVRMLGAHTDITQQKQAEIAFKESEERYKGIFQFSTSGIAIYEVRNNGRDFVFKDLNNAAEKIDKIEKSEIIGKNVLEVFPGVKEFGLFDIFKRVWKTGKPEQHPISIYQDDRILGWRENFIYKLPTGEIVAVYTDETENKRSEYTLLESERKYRTLFESSIDALFLLNVDTGKCIDCNESAIKLHQIESYEKFIGLKPHEFSPEFQPNGQSSEKLAMEYIKKANQKGSAEFEWVHKKRDGTEFPVLVTLSAMNIEDSNVVLAVNRDLTEIKEATEKREKLISELNQALDILQRYESIINSTPDLINLVDRKYVCRLVNKAGLKMFNKTREEMVNKSLVDLQGKKYFEKYSKPNLDRAFSGETVISDQTISISGKSNIHLAVTYHPVKSKNGSINFVSMDARDVTELKSFSDRLALATDAGKVGIWELDIPTNTLIWDDTMLGLYKVEPDEFSGVYDAWRSCVHPEDLDRAEQELEKAIKEKKDYNTEFRIIWPDKQTRHIKAAARLKTDKGKPMSMTGVNWDVTSKRKLEAELRMLAITDPLTGAHNRRYFMDRAKDEFNRSRRYASSIVLLMIDIDNFKKINDTYGHPAGDEVLKSLVSQCKNTLRTSDVFGRIGGEEFSSILTQTDMESGYLTADRLRTLINQDVVETAEGPITYTISMGISVILPEDKTIDNLFQRADAALYLAKKNGRNRVERG